VCRLSRAGISYAAVALRQLTGRFPIKSVASRISLGPLGSLGDAAFNVATLVEAGVLRPNRPDKVARILLELRRWGTSPAAGIAARAIDDPDETFIIDEAGELTFAKVHRRSSALANGLGEIGLREGEGVAIMCRNHRGFVETTLACAKLGANCLYLNTAFAAPQLAEVVEREDPALLVYDEEFEGLLSGVPDDLPRILAWVEDEEVESDGEGVDARADSLEDLIARSPDADPEPPEESSRFVILTSGTTGTPKGAQRGQPETLSPIAALLAAIPFRRRQTMAIPAPLFHSWGFTHFILALPLAATMVLRRRFDPEETLRTVEETHADVLAVVPVMMQRILQLPQEVLDEYDLPSLEITSASGSALPGELAVKWMETFGDNLYNLYGSTEVAYATIATPEDLRAAPGTAGKPPHGAIVKIVDQDGNELPDGETGRIFVGSEMAFEGYTGGGGKDMIDGLLSSGDVGHFDEEGRLFIDGRDDEMIVSGGENVFPREVEDLLARHEAVQEVAVIGVDDDEWGKRLKAFVVTRDDAELEVDEVKAYVKSNLARYKVPREVEFLDSLPRNATGKVLKRELA
jgi:acyl-CoA synthetase (AMP-forming)/AMP-acid ligase II